MPTINEFAFDAHLLGSLGVIPGSRGYQVFVVDPRTGDDGQPGTFQFPMRTLEEAYDRCVSGRGDTVVLMGGPRDDGSTGMTTRLTTSLTWSKDYTHLVGMAAPTMVSQRSRITGPSTGGTFAPLITWSADGCIVKNIQIFDDYTVDPVAVLLTGQRNYFENVHFAGMGAATGGDDAAAASLKISGGSENTFKGCMFGIDTVARSTTNGEVELVSAATRNIFHDCFFSSIADNAGHLWVKIDGSGDIDRYVWFKNCFFYNAVESTGTTMTQGMDVHNTCGGMVILENCSMIGATDWAAADNGNVFISNAAPTAGTSGIATAVTR